VQNVSFRWSDGTPGLVNDLLLWADGRLLLLVFGDPGRPAWRACARWCRPRRCAACRCWAATEPAGALEHVRDPQGHLQGACHVFGHAWALVRPDAYVAATGESIDAGVVDAVARALGATEETA
jgi:3-(3-hydroxy-phenyl)propionate hydroxylase